MLDFFSNFQDSNYVWSFVFGLVFVALFAHDRLFIRIDSNAEKQNRFIELLHPSKLARARMFWIALFFYFACLSLFYVALCALAGPIQVLAPIIWPSDPVGFSTLETSSPAIPLIVGLVLTGLIPQFPLIKRFEEVARRLTLWIVGIPESFNDLTDALFNTRLKADVLPETSKAKLTDMRNVVQALPIDGLDVDRFESSLTKIKSFRMWFGMHSAWPPRKVFMQFHSIWKDISERCSAVEEDLSDLLERMEDADLANPDEVGTIVKRWQALAVRTHFTADDVCALTAIFAENTPYLPERGSGRSLEILRDFVIRARKERDQSQVQFAWALIVTLVPALVMFVVGFSGAYFGFFVEAMLLGSNNTLFETSLYSGLAWLMGSIITYVPAAILAWDTRSRLDRRGEWTERLQSGDLDILRKVTLYARIFMPAWLISFLGLTLFAILYQVSSKDPTLPSSWVLDGMMIVSFAIYGMLGGIFATSLLVLFDWIELARSHGREISAGDFRKLMVCTVFGLAAVACIGSSVFALGNMELMSSEAYVGIRKEIGFKMSSAVIFGLVSLWLSRTLMRDYSTRKKNRRTKRRSAAAYS